MSSIQRFTRQALAVVVLGCATLAHAAPDFKIGFVNTDRIFRESTAAKASQTKLEQEFAKREREVDGLAHGLARLASSPTLMLLIMSISWPRRCLSSAGRA